MGYKQKAILPVMLFLSVFSLFGQTDQENNYAILSGGEALGLYGAIPYASVFAAITPQLFLPYDVSKYFSAGTLVLGGIPAAVIDPSSGLAAMGISSSCFTTAFALEAVKNDEITNFIAWPILNIGQKTQMWAYFNGYQKARAKTAEGEYPYSLPPLTFRDLAKAPWEIENNTLPSVWVPVLASTAVKITSNLLATGGRNAIWSTGKAYLGQKEVPIALGVLTNLALSLLNNTFTAIGEEAVFRGIGYEELSVNWGILAAGFIDSILFPAMHVPYEIQQGLPAESILLNFSQRLGITLSLGWAYNQGGLRASVAGHMWINVFAHVFDYLLNAGVPY